MMKPEILIIAAGVGKTALIHEFALERGIAIVNEPFKPEPIPFTMPHIPDAVAFFDRHPMGPKEYGQQPRKRKKFKRK